MVQIEFDYEQTITVIQANLGDLFKVVINQYLGKSMISPDNVTFVANGSTVNPNLTVEKQMNDFDKINKKMKVLVKIIKEEENKVIIKSKEIICPECHEPCRIKFENYKIKLYGCVNSHAKENINLINFNDTQKIDLSKIICDICKDKNKGNSYKNEFYLCLNCNQNLCPICKYNHEKDNDEHNIIKYDQKFYTCSKHNDMYANYCQDCNKDICFSCIEEHQEHKIISFNNLIPKVKVIKEKLSEIKKTIELFNNNINTIIKKFSDLMKAMQVYYDINIDIFNNYMNKNRNYESLQNINEINFDNTIFKLINDINQNNNFNSKIFNIIELYNKI